MLIHEFLDKDPYIVPEEAPLIIFSSKSAVCMANNGKEKNYKIHIYKESKFSKEL